MISIFAFFAHSIFLMAILLSVLQTRRWKKYWPIPYIISAIVIVLPITHWLIIEFSRGFFSDLSVATLMVCFLYIYGAMRPKSISIQPSFKAFILIMAVILFPSSMGAAQSDLFTLGFPSESGFNTLVILFSLCGLIAWYLKAKQLSIYITLVLCAYNMNLYESQNLWVYIIDPIIMIVFVFGYFKIAIQSSYIFLKSKLVSHV